MFEQDCFSEKILILDYRGLGVQKRRFYYFFGLLPRNSSKDLPIFCMSEEDNRAHCLSKIVFLKKFLISEYRGLIFIEELFFTYLAFTPKWL